MGEITDEFEIADHISMDEIKQRVNDWLATNTGRKFSIQADSSNQIMLRRDKYDLRICTTPCWVIVIGPIYLVSMNISGINATLGLLAIIFVTTVLSVFTFFLRPKTAKYTMTFDHGTPTCVRVTAKIKVLESLPEYYSLKIRLRNPTQEQGPEIGV